MADPTIKYLGKSGEYLTLEAGNIPARNLSTDDYNALGTDARALVRASGLYDYAGYKDAVDAAKAAEAVPETAQPAPAPVAPTAPVAAPKPA